MAAIALMLAACSETLGGFGPTTHVAEVDAEPGAQASNAGNIASLTDVIQRNPNDAAAYNTRGVVYAKLGKYSNAVDDFSHTIELDPRFSGAYTNRALAYR
ncbi:MAG: tetratricopeptide repeat protein, partial [Roseiarcus sp.]